MPKVTGWDDANRWMGVCIAIGLMIGVAVGILTDNLAVWGAIGLATGAGIGAAMTSRTRRG